MRIEHLDAGLLYFASHKKFCSDQELRDYLVGRFPDEEINQHIVAEKLLRDGYLISRDQKMINSVGTEYVMPNYCISFEGLIFLEDCPRFKWQNKPYKWKSSKGTIKIIWQVAKIIIAILNALAILYLMYLSIPSK